MKTKKQNIMLNPKHEPLFEPFHIGKVEIKNKFCMAPLGTLAQSDAQGAYTQDAIEYYAQRARGGVGLIFTGINFVESEVEKHGTTPNAPSPNVNPIAYKRRAKDLIDMVHPFGAKIFLQLTAGFGRSAIPGNVKDDDFVAPSKTINRWVDKPCREITTTEVEYMVQQFVKASKTAKEVGFDGIEIHAVHEGYLLDCFTMTLFNQRNDKYGGDLRGRLTFPIEIVEGIKKECGKDFPVVLRFSIKSYIKALRQGGLPQETFEEKGRDIEEALEAAKILEAAGYDAFDADAGTYDSWYWNHPPMYFENGMYLPLTEQLKKVVNVPVIVAGRMDNPTMAVEALTSGKLDAVSLGRPLLTDADYVNKVKKGDIKDIRPCLSCHDGCFGRLFEGGWGSCAVNAMCGRELMTAFGLATVKKNVVVVGGGPAGLEAARVSALRGHNVTLFEAGSELGGELLVGGRPKFKRFDLQLAKWYENQMNKLKVKVLLNTKADKDLVAKFNPDTVYTAEGSTPVHLKITGIDKPNVTYAKEVLLGKVDAGKKCLIVGGGLVGCELAYHLAQNGTEVTIIDTLSDILKSGPMLPPMNEWMLRDELTYHKVKIVPSAVLNEITDDGANVIVDGKTIYFEVDKVIMSVGYRSVHPLFDEIKNTFPEVYNLGDSRQVRNIRAAIWDGFEAARIN